MNVKRLPFFDAIYNQRSPSGRMESPSLEKKGSLLDQAFKPCPGKQALVLFVDHDLVFQQLLSKYQENPTKDLAAFLEKLRSFQGLFFLVTKPMKKQALPVEIHHYIEIKCPSEELQIRRWQTHLKNSDCHQDELIDLVERYAMHLHEIDFITRQASISAILNGSEEKLELEHIHELINKLRKKKATPVLFREYITGSNK